MNKSMKPFFRRWPWKALCLTAIAAVLIALWLVRAWFMPASMTLAQVEITADAPSSVQVQIRPIVKTIEILGTLRPRKMLELTAPFDATVQSRDFAWGEPLQDGAVLLRLSTDDIDREIREAESAMQKAQAAAEPLRNWSNNVEMQRAQRAVASAQRGAAEGERKLLETRRLLELGVVPRNELDDLLTQQQQAAEQLASAKDELAAVRNRGDVIQRRSVELELDNARTKLKNLQQDRAKNLLRMRLKGTVSPAQSGAARSGGVTTSLEVGSRVKRGDVLLRMQSTDQFELLALVDEVDVVRLQKDQKAQVSFVALADTRLQASVAAVSTLPAISESDRAGEAARYEIRLVLQEASRQQLAQLRQGMSGQVSIEIYRRDDAIVLPFNAVQQDAGGAYVLVVGSQGKATRTAVRTGAAGVSDIEVFGPLQAGTTVLLGSSESLRTPSSSTAAKL